MTMKFNKWRQPLGPLHGVPFANHNDCLKNEKLLMSVNEDVEGADTIEERQEGNTSSDLANDITNFLTNFFLVLKFGLK